MVMEIVVSVVLLLVGIAVLVFIHVCIVGRAFGNGNGINGVIFNPRSVNRSMSQEDIKKLPCFDYKVEGVKESTSPVDCAVCLENFKVLVQFVEQVLNRQWKQRNKAIILVKLHLK
ncbi:uncharacterized protein LOC132632775 [Lycium barbarum]|uniref:uncharacterized protein LOC132632775 n=1 Tax=Lycium barbarum TaxID=112863 RepID=UPI00293E8210|nr:uncharacterized protein LOC132632775 [Lycium barbarum]